MFNLLQRAVAVEKEARHAAKEEEGSKSDEMGQEARSPFAIDKIVDNPVVVAGRRCGKNRGGPVRATNDAAFASSWCTIQLVGFSKLNRTYDSG